MIIVIYLINAYAYSNSALENGSRFEWIECWVTNEWLMAPCSALNQSCPALKANHLYYCYDPYSERMRLDLQISKWSVGWYSFADSSERLCFSLKTNLWGYISSVPARNRQSWELHWPCNKPSILYYSSCIFRRNAYIYMLIFGMK